MKRDMDLIRSMMLAAEAMPAGDSYFGDKIVPAGTDDAIAAEHLKLLFDADFLEGRNNGSLDGPPHPNDVLVLGISWPGHDFLDSIRSDTVWAKTKERLLKVGGTVSLEVLTAVAKSVTKDLLGLP